MIDENATVPEKNDMKSDDVMVLEETSDDEDETKTDEVACNLVHAAGFGVVDTGCGRGLVGEETLARHQQELNKLGKKIKELPAKMHTFRYKAMVRQIKQQEGLSCQLSWEAKNFEYVSTWCLEACL